MDMKVSLIAALCGLLAGVPAAAAPAPATGIGFAIRNVRVFDGEATIVRANVVVRDGRIVAVARGAAIPAGLEVIDGRGKTLLPGLIDSHVHVFPGAQADALRFGVTTELDMFNMSHELPRWRAQRESVAQAAEADTWSAGTGVTVAGGHPNKWVPPDMPRLKSVEEATAFIEARGAEGSDYIKLIVEDNSAIDAANPIPTLSRAEVCATVAAAQARGKLAIAHVTNQSNARIAIECGVNGLAHTFIDAPADAELVQRAKERRIFVISTITLLAASEAPNDKVPAGPDTRLLSASQKRSIGGSTPLVRPGQLELAQETLRRLHAAGVTVLAGTDAPVPGTAHGVSLHRELELLVESGFNPAEALSAATSKPADVFRLGDRGRVKPGYRADLLLVEGDPTTNIANTKRIEGIWKNGFPVERAPRE
jgi:imidazolonepropionase-like amidohydrolase